MSLTSPKAASTIVTSASLYPSGNTPKAAASVKPAPKSFAAHAKGLVAAHMIDTAEEALSSAQRAATSLVAQRRLPAAPWLEPQIEYFLRQIAMMDTNNFAGHVGGGEREGRVIAPLVARRHYYMTHGLGRSGDINADQPKAAGSSLLAKLANALALDALKERGLTSVPAAVVVPLATGMALAMTLQATRLKRPDTAKYVIWPRIDQKTSIKCIAAAGCTPFPVALRPSVGSTRRRRAPRAQTHADPCAACEPSPTRSAGDVAVDEDNSNPGERMCWEVSADDVAAAIDQLGVENIVCVLSTTSCFSPRLPDDPLAIARVCKAKKVPYIVNNAYGLQSNYICRRLNAAFDEDGVDYVVQSTDKNFLVPVGGSVIAGPKSRIATVSALYPGRASAAPTLDLFMTLLSIGCNGWRKLHSDREELMVDVFLPKLRQFAEARNEIVVSHVKNDISFSMTLRNYETSLATDYATLGANLFRHRVTGPKVVVPFTKGTENTVRPATEILGHTFLSYGTHSDTSTDALLVIACAVGMTAEEVDIIFDRLCELYPVAPQPEGSFALVIDEAA